MIKEITKFSKRTIWIHWVSTLLILVLIYTGINMEELLVSENKFTLYRIHFTMGIAVFIVTIVRIIALFKDERPANLYPQNTIKHKLTKWVQNGFYIIISWLCVSGIISICVEGILPSLKSGDWNLLPEITADGLSPIMLSHHIIVKLFFLLLVFHISGFLLHLIKNKEKTLSRIN